jgi:hypothetical protein
MQGQSPDVPPTKPKRSGCVTALIVVGALVVLAFIATVVVIAVFLHSNEGKKVAGAIGEGIRISKEAQNAPGAREIVKAGCAQGMVVDMEKSWAFAQVFLGDGSAEQPKFDFKTIVVCQVDVFRTPPTCEDVKRAYLGAVPEPPGPFAVEVKSMTDTRAKCMSLYGPGGEFLRDLRGGHSSVRASSTSE